MLGVARLLQSITKVKEEGNPQLSILGIIPTRYTRTNHAREVIQRTKQEIGDHIHVFEPPVHESTRFREATGAGKTIFELAPETEGARAYRTIAQEIVTL